MTEFLQSVKADLLDRRLLPIVALVFVGLIAAIAFVVVGGSSSSTPAVTVASAPRTSSASITGIAVAPAQTEAHQAVAETTNGIPIQRGGSARDPFTSLPGANKATTPATSSTPSSASGSSGSAAKSTETKTPATTPSAPKKKAAPKLSYAVAVLFGALPSNPAAPIELQAFEDLKLQSPLPATSPVLIYRGVTAGGKSATFTVYGEVILRGQATCLPSALQCQTVDLKPGQTEQIEALGPAGTPVVYELRIASIEAVKASSAAVGSSLQGESKLGSTLLRQAGLLALPEMHYSTKAGVLVFDTPSRAFGARARSAVRGRSSR